MSFSKCVKGSYMLDMARYITNSIFFFPDELGNGPNKEPLLKLKTCSSGKHKMSTVTTACLKSTIFIQNRDSSPVMRAYRGEQQS